MNAILRMKYPSLHLLKANEADIATVEAALRAAWYEVPRALINSLVESMPRPMKVVRQVRG